MSARTLILGFDSLDTPLLERLMAEGAAPAFRALAERLSRVKILNYPGMGEGVFWPSAATGLPPDGHGRYYCLQFDPKTYRLSPHRGFTGAETIWEKIESANLGPVAVTDWPRSPEARIKNGIVVSDWLAHDRVGAMSCQPASLARDLLDKYGVDPFGDGLCANVPRTSEDFARVLDLEFGRLKVKARFCVDQLKAREWSAFAVAFHEFHDLAHYGFHLHDPAHPKYDAAAVAHVGDPLRRIIAAFDEQLGPLLAAAGPGCEVVLLTGPGMTRLETANDCFDEVLRRLDLGAKTARSSYEQAQHAWRRGTPRWLRDSLSPIVRGVFGVAVNAAEFRNRRFFAVPHNTQSGCVRVNLKGRERYGVVRPGAEFEAIVAALTADLMALREPDSGEPIVDEVIRARYDGPYAALLPDLFVTWRRSRPIRRIMSDKIGIIDAPGVDRTGDHTQEGALWASPAIAEPLSHADFIRPHQAAEAFLSAARRPSRREMAAA